jgi:hypothetical protein
MVIALLAVLGVDLIVLVAFAALVFSRKRWVSHQPGAFRGVLRVVDGEINGLGQKWHRGYGRWVRDVLVWTKGPFLFRNELVAADSTEGHSGRPDGVKHLGDHPVVIRVRVGDATVEVAAGREDSRLVRGPRSPVGAAIHADADADADAATATTTTTTTTGSVVGSGERS